MLKPLMLALALTAAAGAARAADPATNDMRCIVVVGALSGTVGTSQTMRDGVMVAMGYYIGRLKAREPEFDLTARLTELVKGMKPADLQPDFARCGEEMKAIGAETQQVGRALQNLAKAGSPT